MNSQMGATSAWSHLYVQILSSYTTALQRVVNNMPKFSGTRALRFGGKATSVIMDLLLSRFVELGLTLDSNDFMSVLFGVNSSIRAEKNTFERLIRLRN